MKDADADATVVADVADAVADAADAAADAESSEEETAAVYGLFL